MSTETFELRPDQMADLTFLFRNPKSLLLHEPGCGKTPTVAVKIYARSKEGKRTVWVMPKSLLSKNKKELHRFTPLTDEQVVIVDGPKSNQLLKSEKAVVFLMGPDRLKLSAASIPKDIAAFDVDEYHLCYQGATSKKVEAWMNFAGKAGKEFIVMTGTFVNGRLDTCWPAIHAIEPRYYPMGHRQFLNVHAVMDEYDRPLAWRDHSRLQKIIGKHGIRRLFKDIFGDQAVVMNVEDDIELSETQRKYYDELESTAVVALDKYMIDGTMPGVAAIRARQIMEHPNEFPNPEAGLEDTIDLLPKGEIPGKEERLLIHLQDHKDSGEPLVIFSSLRVQQKRIAKMVAEMGMTVALMNSEKSGAQRAKIDEDFQAGKYQVLVCSDKIAGVGFNWQFWGRQKFEVSHCIVASLGYLDGDLIQAFRRMIRQSRKKPLRVTVLSYADSLDQKIQDINVRKSMDANKVDPTRPVLSFKSGSNVMAL